MAAPYDPDLTQALRQQFDVRSLLPDVKDLLAQTDVRSLLPDVQELFAQQLDIRSYLPDMQELIRQQFDFGSYLRELLQQQATATEGPAPEPLPADDLAIEAFIIHVIEKLETLDSRLDLIGSKLDAGPRQAIRYFVATLIFAVLLAAISYALEYAKLLTPATR